MLDCIQLLVLYHQLLLHTHLQRTTNRQHLQNLQAHIGLRMPVALLHHFTSKEKTKAVLRISLEAAVCLEALLMLVSMASAKVVVEKCPVLHQRQRDLFLERHPEVESVFQVLELTTKMKLALANLH